MLNELDKPRADSSGSVLAVSVGRPKIIDRNGEPARTAIYKRPVDGPIRARGVNLEADDQADRQGHGGHDKAVYAYADEDRQWWQDEVGRSIEVAGFGENLTTSDIDVTGAIIGEHWQIGTVVLEVSEPRVPCWKLNHRMADPKFVQRFAGAGRPGAYLRIVEEGILQAGDQIHVVDVPDHGLTVGDVSAMYRTRQDVERILVVDAMSDAWKAWATRTIERR
jgi:MOSC domain-containing protein YiiM